MTPAPGVKKILDVRMTWLLFCLCWLVYFSSYIGRLNYSSTMPDMIQAGWIGLSQAGSVSTVFFICYAAGQLINGLLGDRFNPGTMVLTGLGTSAIANVLMPLAPGYGYVLLCWAVNGYALSMLWPPIVRIFADMLDEGSMVKCCVHLTSSTVAGHFGAYLLSALFIRFFGWKAVFYSAAVLLAAVAVLWWFLFRRIENYRRENGVTENVPVIPGSKEPGKGLITLLMGTGLLVFLGPVMVHGALKDGITAWIPTLLAQSFAVSSSKAVLVSTLLPVINLSGAYAARFVFQKWIKNESLCAAFFFGTALVGLGGLMGLGSVHILLSVVFLSVVTSSMLAVNTLLISLLPLRFRRIGRAATITGFFNAAAYLGSAGTTAGIGWMVGGFGWSAAIIGMAGLALLAFLICLAGGRVRGPSTV